MPYNQDAAGPARDAFAITPHATNSISRCRAIYVGGAGNIVLRATDSNADVTLVGVPAGTLLPVAVSHVRVTGTTATSLVGFS